MSLEQAVRIGDIDQVKRHLHWQTPLDRPDINGDTPLHVAARAGQVSIAEALVEHGAETAARNGAGQTPLEVALLEGKTQVVRMLFAQGAALDSQGLLELLVRKGAADRDAFDLLVRQGVDLDRPNADGNAALHLAVRGGHLETVSRLLRLGADINQPDGAGRLPLDIATEQLDRKGRDAANILALLQRLGARSGAWSLSLDPEP